MTTIIGQCCGLKRQESVLDLARQNCTRPSWDLPPGQSLDSSRAVMPAMISIMRGEEEGLDAEQAMNDLLMHLEQGEQSKNEAAILKYLIILDLLAEQRLFLNKIGHYYNNQLLYLEGTSKATSLFVKELIASYYEYIKQKAKFYENQSRSLIDCAQREKYLNESPTLTILNQINLCFKIQNLILNVNDQYKDGNKTSALIKYVFCLLLRTYIFCHSIVVMGLKIFVTRVPTLNHYDLQYTKKLVKYYQKEYRRNLVRFINQNKDISSFSAIQTDHLVLQDKRMVEIIQEQIYNLSNDPGVCPDPEDLPGQSWPMLEVDTSLGNCQRHDRFQTEYEGRLQRRKIDKCLRYSSEVFTGYSNFYCQQLNSGAKDQTEIHENCQKFQYQQ